MLMQARLQLGLALVVVLVLASPLPSAATIIATEVVKAGATGLPIETATFGWQFRANRQLQVRRLGLWSINTGGLVNPHSVGIWTDSGTLLGSAGVATGLGAIDIKGFRWSSPADLTTPIQLTAGTVYRIGATCIGGDADLLLLESGGTIHSFNPAVTYLNLVH